MAQIIELSTSNITAEPHENKKSDKLSLSAF